ncbi:MAG: cell wall hydrolase [Burkholderiales bacterium]
MYFRPLDFGFASRFAWAVSRWWLGVRVSWYVLDKGPLIFAAIAGLIVTIFGFALHSVFMHREHTRNLTCLALNVYFEARGEPEAGQLAVAEVTMNRLASNLYPDTVCGVVYQKNWDALRKRYVGAFSWTEFDTLPQPAGEEWRRAGKAAEAVYYRREAPVLQGALFYHATYSKPSWAKGKRRVATIGRHVFYR